MPSMNGVVVDLARGGGNMIAVRLSDAAPAAVIDLPPRARRVIAEEASFRRLSTSGLVARLLEQIVDHDLFAVVLDAHEDRG